MVVTLTGEDSYGLQSALKELVAGFVQEHGDMALERLNGAEASFERIQESLQSSPFLAARKLVVLRESGANKRFVEQSEKLLSGLPDTTDVIMVETKLDKRSAYYKYLKRATDYREFIAPDEAVMAQWLSGTAKARGGSLSTADARFLVERVGPDRQLLASELEKLMLYDPAVSRPTIELLSEPAPQSTIFALLEAAFGGQTKRALDLFQEQRRAKVDPAQIIAMLTWQLWVVTVIKAAGDRSTDEIAREAKLNPYVVRKSQTIARQLSVMQLKRLVAELLALDIRSKREGIDLDEALQHYLLTLSS